MQAALQQAERTAAVAPPWERGRPARRLTGGPPHELAGEQ